MDILHLTGTFGRLDHSELSLSPGLNVLYAPNETGKSTWGAFIRTMLYGLSTRERGPLADKNRYAPWTGAPMQGRMDLTTHGDACTLLRETRRAASPLGEFPAPTPVPARPFRALPARTPARCCWACPGRCLSAAPLSAKTLWPWTRTLSWSAASPP